MTKVPEIIVIFWVLKLLTTGMGEAMSDFLGKKSVPLAGAIGIFGLCFALWLQMRQREYRAPIYWFAVMMVAIFGTMAADGVHIGASLSYAVTTPFFAIVVAAIFFCWYRSEGTLSIHSITTRRRESFYWAAVLATFALGTAAGDLTAISLNLGFFDSVLLFAAIIAIPAIGWWRFEHEPDPRVLVCLRRHPPARRLLRGLVQQASRAVRSRPRRRHRQRDRAASCSSRSSPTWPSPSATFRANDMPRLRTNTRSIHIYIRIHTPSRSSRRSSTSVRIAQRIGDVAIACCARTANMDS